jgi:predicted TIM-barrel fold metal-dependent hydrolase
MAIVADAPSRAASGSEGKLAVIDADVHPVTFALDPNVAKFLSARSRRYLGLRGVPMNGPDVQIPRQRAFAHRLDSVPPGGGSPGSDPDFARLQVLDEFDMVAGVLNNFGGLMGYGSNNPVWLATDVVRAYNEWLRECWLEADGRWYGSISVAAEQAEWSAGEVARAVASHDRFVQVIVGSRTEHPIGDPRYWPIFEAAERHGLSVAFHVAQCRTSQITASGMPNYYFEDHTGFAQQNFSLVASLIFQGVFDRFPGTRIVLTELGWSWAAAFAWRLDASWRVFKDEIPELERTPSEYLRDHFWFTTQPMEEPEQPEWFERVYAQFERAGLGERLLFSSDYPHWDFDSPDDALPPWLPEHTRASILAANASALWGIPVPSAGTPA